MEGGVGKVVVMEGDDGGFRLKVEEREERGRVSRGERIGRGIWRSEDNVTSPRLQIAQKVKFSNMIENERLFFFFSDLYMML